MGRVGSIPRAVRQAEKVFRKHGIPVKVTAKQFLKTQARSKSSGLKIYPSKLSRIFKEMGQAHTREAGLMYPRTTVQKLARRNFKLTHGAGPEKAYYGRVFTGAQKQAEISRAYVQGKTMNKAIRGIKRSARTKRSVRKMLK